MKQNFCMEQRHKVNSANFNFFQTGMLHPDRIIQEHDLVYLIEGEWEIWQDDKKYTLQQDDVLILHQGHHHFGFERCKPATKTMYLHIDPVFGDRFLAQDWDSPSDKNNLLLNTLIHCKNTYAVKKLFEDIIYTFWSQQDNREIKAAAYTDLLLYELSTLSCDSCDFSDSLIHKLLYQIKMTPQKIYTIEELAQLIHISPRSLVSRFKAATGKSVHQYQLDLKLEMAYAQIIYDPQKPFKEIASNFGFCDEFHFSKLFKRRFGIPPAHLKQGFIGRSSLNL